MKKPSDLTDKDWFTPEDYDEKDLPGLKICEGCSFSTGPCICHDTMVGLEAEIEKAKKLNDIAERLCRKFTKKVETGRARSKETYADCLEFLTALDQP